MEKLAHSAGRNVHVQVAKDEFVYVETYNYVKEVGYRFSWEKYDGSELKTKILADILTRDTASVNGWRIDPYSVRHIDGDQELMVMGRHLDTVIRLQASDLYKMKEDFEEMDFFELRRHIGEMKNKGSDGVKAYQVEMHQRMASPAAVLILTLIGAALSSRKVRGGIGMHLGIGIAIAFSYILFMQVSKSFAISGELSPFLAAWIPNLIFCALGIYLLKKAPK